MYFKYGLEDRPPWRENLLYALQWLAVTLPAVVIMGKVLGGFHPDVEAEILYLQKLFAIMGLALLAQLLWGHRLPIVIGPAAVLMIGVLASQASSPQAVYGSIFIGGVVLALLAVTGIFARMQGLFTPRVVAVILLLVAFTMVPTIIQLIAGGSAGMVPRHLAFAFVFMMAIFAGQRYLNGLWKSTLILWAMIAGSIAYFAIFSGLSAGSAQLQALKPFAGFFQALNPVPAFQPGVIVAFLLCFVGLSINDLGSMQAVGAVLKVDDMPVRMNHGIIITGIANAFSGLLGVVGPVNFSFSPGVIASTGCAARRSLIPAGIIMLALAFLPQALFCLSFIPSVVTGCVLLYTMCAQVGAGLMAVFEAEEEFHFDDGLLVALPILTGIIVAFLPQTVTTAFPGSLRPILSNGFVVGIVCSLILEHVLFRNR